MLCEIAYQNFDTKRDFSTFPIGFVGSSEKKRTREGALYGAIRPLAHPRGELDFWELSSIITNAAQANWLHVLEPWLRPELLMALENHPNITVVVFRQVVFMYPEVQHSHVPPHESNVVIRIEL
jgi:hypothetical protein